MNADNFSIWMLQDSCRLKLCEELGPAASKESCKCLFLTADSGCGQFGRILLPDHPVAVPICTSRAEIRKGSFHVSRIEVLNTLPSPLCQGYWQAELLFSFEFFLQFFDFNGKPFKIVCFSNAFDEPKPHQIEKMYLQAGIQYRRTVMLYGGKEPPIRIFTAPMGARFGEKSPRFAVEAAALPLRLRLKPACCACGAYEEPCLHVYVTAGLLSSVRLLRSTCCRLSYKCTVPRTCSSLPADSCAYFRKIEFPRADFYPK